MTRVQVLQLELARTGLVGALVTSPENIRYLTGYYTNAFNPFTVAVVPSRGQPALVVLRQDESLATVLSRILVLPHDLRPEGFRVTAATCRQVLEDADVPSGPFGLEFGSVTMDRHRILQETMSHLAFSDATELLTGLRMVKDADERLALKRAAPLATASIEHATHALRPGVSEAEVKAIIYRTTHIEAARMWPDAIVQAAANVLTGPKVARLHDFSSGRVMATGEAAFLLAGASWNGYWGGDMARTAFVPGARPDVRVEQALEGAIEAQRAAIERLEPGEALGEAARAAELVLRARGLEEKRIYRPFRGLGLTNSERPTALELDLPLRPGMCLCVQIYLQIDGITVGQTDSVLITEHGRDMLTGVASAGAGIQG